MSYEFYKTLHILGISAILLGLGAMLLQAMNHKNPKFDNRRWVMLVHGFGMLITFVAGFGLMARTQISSHWPHWIYVKLTIWLYLGGVSALILRRTQFAKLFWFTIIAAVGLAASMAIYKPAL